MGIRSLCLCDLVLRGQPKVLLGTLARCSQATAHIHKDLPTYKGVKRLPSKERAQDWAAAASAMQTCLVVPHRASEAPHGGATSTRNRTFGSHHAASFHATALRWASGGCSESSRSADIMRLSLHVLSISFDGMVVVGKQRIALSAVHDSKSLLGGQAPAQIGSKQRCKACTHRRQVHQDLANVFAAAHAVMQPQLLWTSLPWSDTMLCKPRHGGRFHRPASLRQPGQGCRGRPTCTASRLP